MLLILGLCSWSRRMSFVNAPGKQAGEKGFLFRESESTKLPAHTGRGQE